MGTKANPAQFDCYANALPDEPMFVLLARDPLAPGQVREWADLREEAINTGNQPESDRAMVDEARACALNMEQWRKDNNGKWRITMPNPQPTQMEQRMEITHELLENWRVKFDARYMTSAIDEYAPEEFGMLLDEVARLRAITTRPTADLGDDGELVERLRLLAKGHKFDAVPVVTEAADRLILYLEARDRVEQVISAWAFAHNIDGAARNDLFERLRRAVLTQKEGDK